VVIVEKDQTVIDTLSETIDCGFLHGDGTKPAVLREADPQETDFLFGLSGDNQTNIIASLVGRSLGFRRVVTKVDDEELEHICIELGLTDTIIPDLTIGRYLADIVEGQDIMELALIYLFVPRCPLNGHLARSSHSHNTAQSASSNVHTQHL